VRDLGGLAVNKGGMTAQLRHARFERSAGAGGGEEEQHRKGLVAQQGMGFAQGALAFQVPGHV
jgi:hypothetical protein